MSKRKLHINNRDYKDQKRRKYAEPLPNRKKTVNISSLETFEIKCKFCLKLFGICSQEDGKKRLNGHLINCVKKKDIGFDTMSMSDDIINGYFDENINGYFDENDFEKIESVPVLIASRNDNNRNDNNQDGKKILSMLTTNLLMKIGICFRLKTLIRLILQMLFMITIIFKNILCCCIIHQKKVSI
jgi:hypothetical protein